MLIMPKNKTNLAARAGDRVVPPSWDGGLITLGHWLDTDKC